MEVTHHGGDDSTERHDLEHMGRASDLVASDTHKILTFAVLVRRDLVLGLGARGDAETLRLAARQLRDRAAHLADLADELAQEASP